MSVEKTGDEGDDEAMAFPSTDVDALSSAPPISQKMHELQCAALHVYRMWRRPQALERWKKIPTVMNGAANMAYSFPDEELKNEAIDYRVYLSVMMLRYHFCEYIHATTKEHPPSDDAVSGLYNLLQPHCRVLEKSDHELQRNVYGGLDAGILERLRRFHRDIKEVAARVVLEDDFMSVLQDDAPPNFPDFPSNTSPPPHGQ